MFNLVEFIEMDGDLEEKLEKLEGALKRDEVIELGKCKQQIVDTLSISSNKCFKFWPWFCDLEKKCHNQFVETT